MKGASAKVVNGLTSFLLSLPKKRISRKRIASWWKWSRSGRSVGFPVFNRRQIANPVSATGQKNIKKIANGLISVVRLISRIADQTSKCPSA